MKFNWRCRWQARQAFAAVGNAALQLAMQAGELVRDPVVEVSHHAQLHFNAAV
jgi:hypothetical protein